LGFFAGSRSSTVRADTEVEQGTTTDMSDKDYHRDLSFDDMAALSYDGAELAPRVAETFRDIPWAEIVDEDETQIDMEDIWFRQDEPPEYFPLPPIPVVVFVLFLIAFLL
jgi:hypothetical protein